MQRLNNDRSREKPRSRRRNQAAARVRRIDAR
nr:MAG TPA: hypothetical protein [Caudoviricetes sp.]